jgi:hypothetical protein
MPSGEPRPSGSLGRPRALAADSKRPSFAAEVAFAMAVLPHVQRRDVAVSRLMLGASSFTDNKTNLMYFAYHRDRAYTTRRNGDEATERPFRSAIDILMHDVKNRLNIIRTYLAIGQAVSCGTRRPQSKLVAIVHELRIRAVSRIEPDTREREQELLERLACSCRNSAIDPSRELPSTWPVDCRVDPLRKSHAATI